MAADTNAFVNGPQEERHMSHDLTDLQNLMQATIDLKPLQPYYHVGQEPNRKPLIVLKNSIVNQDLSLSKFGSPVAFLSRTEIGDRPYLEITKLTHDGTSAEVEFVYPVEGIRGTVYFKKTGDSWVVETHEIVEK
jgi:hypothetical protein